MVFNSIVQLMSLLNSLRAENCVDNRQLRVTVMGQNSFKKTGGSCDTNPLELISCTRTTDAGTASVFLGEQCRPKSKCGDATEKLGQLVTLFEQKFLQIEDHDASYRDLVNILFEMKQYIVDPVSFDQFDSALQAGKYYEAFLIAVSIVEGACDSLVSSFIIEKKTFTWSEFKRYVQSKTQTNISDVFSQNYPLVFVSDSKLCAANFAPEFLQICPQKNVPLFIIPDEVLNTRKWFCTSYEFDEAVVEAIFEMVSTTDCFIVNDPNHIKEKLLEYLKGTNDELFVIGKLGVQMILINTIFKNIQGNIISEEAIVNFTRVHTTVAFNFNGNIIESPILSQFYSGMASGCCSF